MVAEDAPGARNARRSRKQRREHRFQQEGLRHLFEREEHTADGALNATSSPAPPRAVCTILTSESGNRARRAASAPIAAPMWTVGPSRPSTSPEPMLNTPPTNFAGTTRISGGRVSPRKAAS